LKPQRSGMVDAYLLVAGLDSDPVFGRESTETAKVLARRYDAAGRSVLLASGTTTAPDGSPPNLAAALAAIAERMDKAEDVLVLYATAHGAPGIGIVYKDGEKGYGMIAPQRLAGLLDELGIKRRLIIVSACYSGQFVDALAGSDSVVLTAADNDRTSFGCEPSNDWTYFGDALINRQLRTPAKLEPAASDAYRTISEWEFADGLTSSKPRIFMGERAKAWLATLEARIPAGETPRVGKPAVASERSAAAGR
jgi:Peptidase C13 family